MTPEEMEAELQKANEVLAAAEPAGLDMAAGIQFDLYMSWVRAGFSPGQAIYLTGVVVALGSGPAFGPPIGGQQPE